MRDEMGVILLNIRLSHHTEAMAVSITFLKESSLSISLLSFTLNCYTGDTVLHSWEVLAKILSSDITINIVCDIGM